MINETFQKSVAKTDEEERKRMLEETVTSPNPRWTPPGQIPPFGSNKLAESAEEDDEAALRYAEEAERVRSGPRGNWALADQLQETAKRLRGQAMQKRRRAVTHDIQNTGHATSFTPYTVPF
jgi:hypothetical protein